MALQLVMFQVVPNLFVRIPVWRITWKMKHMEALLAVDIRVGLFRCMRRSLIHHHDKVTTGMMLQHLSEEIDYFTRRNALGRSGWRRGSE